MFAFVPTAVLGGSCRAGPCFTSRGQLSTWAAIPKRVRTTVRMSAAADDSESPAKEPTAAADALAAEAVAPAAEAKAPAAEADAPAAETAAPAEEEFVLPPEAYPGYYADLERAGIDPVAEMKKKKEKSKKKKVGGRASLYKPDGTPYAPWMVRGSGAVIEDAPEVAPRKAKTDAVGMLANDPQAQELAGTGLKHRLLGDELVLYWATGDETSNQGFIVRKRKGKTDAWTKLGDFQTNPAELSSKGPKGGSYSFLDANAEPGTWIYRVSDVNMQGEQSDLSQTIVEVQSAGEQRGQLIALIAVVVILIAFGAIGLLTDPLSNLGAK